MAAASPTRTRSRSSAIGIAPANAAPGRRSLVSTRLAPPEDAGRPPHQQHDHHQIDEEGADGRDVILAGNVADAEQHRGGKRTGNRTEAADRYDDQDVNEIGQGKRRIEPDQFYGQRAAEAGKPAAEGEGNCE